MAILKRRKNDGLAIAVRLTQAESGIQKAEKRPLQKD